MFNAQFRSRDCQAVEDRGLLEIVDIDLLFIKSIIVS